MRACIGGCAGHGGHAGGGRAEGVVEMLDGCHSAQPVSTLERQRLASLLWSTTGHFLPIMVENRDPSKENGQAVVQL